MELENLWTQFERYARKEISLNELKTAINISYNEERLEDTDEKGETFLHKLVKYPKVYPDVIQYVVQCKPELVDEMTEGYPYQTPAQLLQQRMDKPQEVDKEIPLRSIARLFANVTKEDDVQADLNDRLLMRVGRLDTMEHKFAEVPVQENVQLDKPTLFCFSGQGCTSQALADRFAALVTDSVRTIDQMEFETTLQVFSVWYPGNIEDVQKDRDYYRTRDKTGGMGYYDAPEKYIRPVVEKYFRPLYCKDNQKIDVDEASKNLRNLNFVSYSYGATVVQMISEIMKADMERLGYEDNQVRQMQRQIFSLTMGGDVDYDRDLNNFTSVHMVNSQDNVVPLTLAQKVEAADGYSDNGFRIVHLQKKKNKTYILSKDLKLTDFLGSDGHSAARYGVTTHNPEVYFFDSVHSQNRLFGAMRSAALINAINSSYQTARFGELKEMPTKLLTEPRGFQYLKTLEDKTQMGFRVHKNFEDLRFDDAVQKAYKPLEEQLYPFLQKMGGRGA